MEDLQKEEKNIKEPSVLDYVKAKIMFWRGPAPEIPAQAEPNAVVENRKLNHLNMEDNFGANSKSNIISILTLSTIVIFILISRNQTDIIKLIFYLLSILSIFIAYLNNKINLAQIKPISTDKDNFRILLRPMLVGLVFAFIAFLSFWGNRFTGLNIFLLLLSFGFVLRSIWQTEPGAQAILPKFKHFLQQKQWNIQINQWIVLWVVVFSIGIFFKTYQLGQVVPEMVSDHAEKLLDVFELMQGETRIYFPRNTGREALQMYMIAAVAKYFGTGISFLSMKIGTVLAGIFMLPFVYLLGKEVGNKWVGLIAMLIAGIAYWPNILSRVALRFILYPAFVAPTLFFLLRGLRRSKRNDFIWAGIFLGIGLHGYTPFRFMPILVVLAIILFILHNPNKTSRRNAVLWIGIIALVSLILFLPLLRYWLEEPLIFSYRAFSRVGVIERDVPGSIIGIFFSNLWNALKMVNWDSGNIWVVGVPHQPAVDLLTGAMFLLGSFMLLLRYLRQKNWQDLFILLAVPMLMMPSILSLAFPAENPALNRAGGAMVVIFVIAALALEAILRAIYENLGNRGGAQFTFLIGGFLLLISIGANYNMVFDTFTNQYKNGAWNTSEMGGVISEFANTVGDKDSAWVVASPHWVDNRLVGINAGFPDKNYEIWPGLLATTVDLPAPKLFLYRLDNIEAAEVLRELYPNGANSIYPSEQENKSFYMFFVPANEPIP